MTLHAGYWRAGDEYAKILACGFGEDSCPGANAICMSDKWAYCACGYAGPLCSECDARGDAGQSYYLSSISGACESCNDGASYVPNIALGCAVVLFLALVAAAVYSARACLKEVAQVLSNLYRVGKIKLSMIMYSCQVISQFTTVVTSADATSNDSAGYPSSAVSFAGFLGFFNLDIAAFVPVGCFAPNTTFYDTLVFKTVFPLILIGLLWSRPLRKMITGHRSVSDERCAARWSLFVLELVVLGVSTTIVQAFSCDQYEDGLFMRVQASVSRPLYERLIFTADTSYLSCSSHSHAMARQSEGFIWASPGSC